jgi:CrcB protein
VSPTQVALAAGFCVCAALGALLRWWAGVGRLRRWHDHLPLPTLLVNLVGSFALGCLVGSGVTAPTITLAGTGLIGAFTTFSTFIREGHALSTAGDHGRAVLYVVLSLGFGLAAALAGLALTS